MEIGCKIEKLGEYLTLDSDGYILNTTKLSAIQSKWKPCVDEIVDEYKKHYGDALHSVYLRGSVAKGKAIENISDIDTFAVVMLSNEDIDRSWEKGFLNEFMEKHSFVNGVELQASPLEGFEKRRGQKILIKTQSICLYGENIANEIESMKPGLETTQHLQHLGKEILGSIELLQNEVNEKKILNECTWIMKRILRGAFELVMERSNQYTRDLYLCYEGFSKYYPNQKNEMYLVLEMAVCPTQDVSKITSLLEGIGNFVIQESNIYLSKVSR